MDSVKIYYRIRNLCGILGMALPWLALIGGALAPDKPTSSWWHSISATYYFTPMLAAILTAAAIVLICYDGYTLLDNIVTTAAGIAGICVVLFPCSAGWLDKATRVGYFGVPMYVSSILHNISAAVLFMLLAFNCLFLFTRHGEEVTDRKKIRNMVYYVCGIGMAVFLVLFPILQAFVGGWTVIISETILLQFFGFAWLVKGGAILADRKEDEKEVP